VNSEFSFDLFLLSYFLTHLTFIKLVYNKLVTLLVLKYYRNRGPLCRPISFSCTVYTDCFHNSCFSLPTFGLFWTSCLPHEEHKSCSWCILQLYSRFTMTSSISVFLGCLTIVTGMAWKWERKLGPSNNMWTWFLSSKVGKTCQQMVLTWIESTGNREQLNPLLWKYLHLNLLENCELIQESLL
jgi:hypothetical protein